MLRRTHSSHLGIEASLRKARDSLYWPFMNEEIKDFVSQCSTCSTFQHKQQKEPLMTHDIPEQPWLKLGIDIFSVKTDDYLVTVYYYSDFFELDLLPDTTAATVINCLKQLRKLLSQIMGPSSKQWNFTSLHVIGNFSTLPLPLITASPTAKPSQQ